MTNTNGPEPSRDEVESSIRRRIEGIDREIADKRELRETLRLEIKALVEEKEKWGRMLPRAPRRRGASASTEPALPGV